VQNTLHLLLSLKVHYRAQKSPPFSISWAKLINFTPLNPIYWRSTLIFSTYLRLYLASYLSSFFLSSPCMYWPSSIYALRIPSISCSIVRSP
jgi:hypothetical protein